MSRTAKCSSTDSAVRDSTATETTTSPRSVNLIALPVRLTTIWRRRPGSAMIVSGTSGRISLSSSNPFVWARSERVLTVSPRLSRISKEIGSRSSFPASIFEKSRISLITVRSESADDLTNCRYSCCSASRSVSRASSVIPRIPFIGVRISWLILARNSDFARVAASAVSFATCSSSKAACLASNSAVWLMAAPIRPAISSSVWTSTGLNPYSSADCTCKTPTVCCK